MKKEVFRMERVTYKEQGVLKLEDLNLNVFEGEILGFVPVNSYGMQELLALIKQNLSLYDGYVYYDETLVNSWKGPLQTNNRITVISNESSLVEKLTVVDNIFVLRQNYKGEFIRTKILEQQLRPFLEEIHVQIEADMYVSKLSVFERIVVALLKGVIAGHKLIVLHELDTLLTANELKEIHEIIRFYTRRGISFIYICSHLEDTISICDRAMLLINGRIEKVLQSHEIQSEKIISVFLDYASLVRNHLEDRKEYEYSQENVCEVNYKFTNIDAPFRFQVHQGECLVIQCLDNEMYYDLRNAIVRDDITEDSVIRMGNQRVTFHRNIHISIVQENPTVSMLFPELTYMDNLCFNLGGRMREVWWRRGIKRSIRQEFERKIDNEVFEIPVTRLTEKQKYQLVYTRILLQKPKVVFCIQPFQGADLEHRMYIWTLLDELLKKGISVVILAVNLADSLSIADRLIRVDAKNQQYEFASEDFSSMPSLVPWQFMYKSNEKQE